VHLALALANMHGTNRWRRVRMLAGALCGQSSVAGMTTEDWHQLATATHTWLWLAVDHKARRDQAEVAEQRTAQKRARLFMYKLDGTIHSVGNARTELRQTLARLTSGGRPLLPCHYAALGAALVYSSSERFQGTKERYTFQERFGWCKHLQCDKFFFRDNARGPYGPRYCSDACGNAARVAKHAAKRLRRD
jgi:hypothetical protein